MSIMELLDRPIAYHRVFVTLTGSVKAAVFLSQAVYWQKRAKQKDGFWYKTSEEWTEETGLSRHEQDTARKACEKYLKSDLRDVPARLYWKVDEEALSEDLIAVFGQSSLPKSGKQESRKASNINKNAETTTDKSLSEKDLEQVNRKVDAIIESSLGVPNWSGRDFFRADHFKYVDWYHNVTGQDCPKSKRNDWHKAVMDWGQAGLEVSDLQAAYNADISWRGVFTSPNQLTVKAIALKAQSKTQVVYKDFVDTRADIEIVPNPKRKK